MWTKLFGLAAAAASVITLSGAPPALAVCNPGTPHCITASNNYFLNDAKKQVHQGDGNFNCDPGPAGICSDELPGTGVKTTPSYVMPKAGVSTMTVAPRMRR